MIEFDCKRCGIHVVAVIDETPPENRLCRECNFIEQLPSAEARAVLSEMLDRQRAKDGAA